MAENEALPFVFGESSAKTARFTVKCPECPPPAIDCIDEDGDLILQVGEFQCQHVREGAQEEPENQPPFGTFRVCSRTLSRSSPVMKKMLFGGFAESKPSEDQPWTVYLPEDNARALRVLLDIIHSRFDRVPSKAITIDDLYNITILSDKYGLTRILRPWAKKWKRKTFVERSSLDKSLLESGYLEKRLWVSWEFGDLKEFSQVGEWIASLSDLNSDGELIRSFGDVASCGYFDDLEEPPEIYDAILNARGRSIEELLMHVSSLVSILVEGGGRGEVRCIHRHAQCDALALGSIIISLARAGLWPVPEPSEYSKSLSSLLRSVRALNVLFYCRNTNCKNAGSLGLPAITSRMQLQLSDMHRKHCLEQAKKSGVNLEG